VIGDQAGRAVATVATAAVVCATFTGSASALVGIARQAHMAAPAVLPVGLDGVAIVAAVAVQRCRRDRLAWATLVAATVVSTALQVHAAPTDTAARLAHAVPPVATLLAFELFLRATTTTTGAAVVALEAAADRAEVTVPVAVTPRRPARARSGPVQSGGGGGPGRAGPVDGVVWSAAQRVAVELAGSGRGLSRRALQDGLRAAGCPVGTTRAAQLLARLRAHEDTGTGAGPEATSEQETGEGVRFDATFV
jgi:hypothetical protein